MGRIKTNAEIEEELIVMLTFYKHGFFYRSIRTLATILQQFPPFTVLFSSKISNDDQAYKMLRSIVGGPALTCYTMPSHLPNAFTIPGAPILGKKEPVTLGLTKFFSGIYEIFVILEQISNRNIDLDSVQISDGKIWIPNLTDINIYITDKFQEILTPEEQVAVMLHEVGHNIQMPMVLKSNAVQYLSMFIWPVILIYYMMSRHMERTSDSIAIQCGYGAELANGLKKMRALMSTVSFITSGFNILEQALNLLVSVSFQIERVLSLIGLSTHPNIDLRIRDIERKVNSENMGLNNALNKADIYMNNTLLYCSNKLFKVSIN